MYLEDKENIVLGKLIGLVNGLQSDPNIFKIEKEIEAVLKTLKFKNSLENSIILLVKLKKEYLPDCLVCKHPCGKSDDFYLNSIANNEYRDKKINEYNDLISNYEKILDYKDLLYRIYLLSV